jgi:hypothetical protein
VDVITATSAMTLPITGVVAKIYITLDNNKIYRWNGTIYQELALTDVSAIKAIDEGNGVGYVIANRNPLNYGNVGLRAVDLSYSSFGGSYGATGTGSVVFGTSNISSGINSIAGGAYGESSGPYSTQFGVSNLASGQSSFCAGESNISSGANSVSLGNWNKASGFGSFSLGYLSVASGYVSVAIGKEVLSKSAHEAVFGSYNTDYTPLGGSGLYNFLDRAFSIGNGSNQYTRSDALIVLKNGLTTIPSVTNALITAEPTGKAVVTKEYLSVAPISTATQVALDLKANDANVVHNGGDEFIGGTKTLANDLGFSDSYFTGDRGSLGIYDNVFTFKLSDINLLSFGKSSLNIYSNSQNKAEIWSGLLTSNQSYALPNKSGTFALSSELPVWTNVSSSNYFQNSTLVPTIIEDMNMNIGEAGTYKVDFNGQFNTQLANITQQAVVDLNALYLNLNSQAVTNPAFPTFGVGTTIYPGVYETAGAVGPVGSITLNGQGNPNSIFIFRTIAAVTVGAGCTFNLINGATANNVYFIAGGAISVGANSNTSGTFISPLAAVGVGAGAYLNGRVFSIGGAITNNGNITVSTLSSQFPMGITSNFAIFTTAGAVSNVGFNIIVGDIGTNNGTITGFETATHSGFIYLPNQGASVISFGIYVNGVLSSSSVRERVNSITKEDVILSDVITTSRNSSIAVKATNSIGISRFYNRILTVTKIQ